MPMSKAEGFHWLAIGTSDPLPRFDVYSDPSGSGYLVDVQADLLSRLTTRVVVPLIPCELAPSPAAHLNPVFDIEGKPCSFVTQFMAAIPRSELTTAIASLTGEADTILGAIDFLHQGW